jgi:hypothetical protein
MMAAFVVVVGLSVTEYRSLTFREAEAISKLVNKRK